MDAATVLELLRKERRSLRRSNEVLDADRYVVRRTIEGSLHEISWSDLDAVCADAAIAAQIAHYQVLGKSFEWKVFADDEPADLVGRLGAAGFAVGPREAVMVHEATAAARIVRDDSPCMVSRVETDADLREFKATAEEVFGKDYSFTTGALRAARDQGCTDQLAFIGRIGGQTACVGRLYTHASSAFGGLYGGGTLPEFRGRGCYCAMVSARSRVALAMGARYVLVDALPTSEPILLRLGFERVTYTWPCTWSPP